MRLTRFEHVSQPMAPRGVFLRRWAMSLALVMTLAGASLLIGVIGYHYFEGREWLDAFDDAAMILSGMGPLTDPKTGGGKLFAGIYALYSGLLLIVTTGILLAPLLHRILHHFHVPDEDGQQPSPSRRKRSATGRRQQNAGR
jgi:hypothetical protein